MAYKTDFPGADLVLSLLALNRGDNLCVTLLSSVRLQHWKPWHLIGARKRQSVAVTSPVYFERCSRMERSRVTRKCRPHWVVNDRLNKQYGWTNARYTTRSFLWVFAACFGVQPFIIYIFLIPELIIRCPPELNANPEDRNFVVDERWSTEDHSWEKQDFV